MSTLPSTTGFEPPEAKTSRALGQWHVRVMDASALEEWLTSTREKGVLAVPMPSELPCKHVSQTSVHGLCALASREDL